MIELLIVVAIFAVVFVVVGAMFVSSSRAYRVSEAVSQRQQNTMTARGLLQNELSLAGYRGVCAAAAGSDPFSSVFSFVVEKALSDKITVRYIDDRWGEAGPSGTCGEMRTVSFEVGHNDVEDGLWVQYGDDVGLAVENVVRMRLLGYVSTDGGVADSKPPAFIGVVVELQYSDAPTDTFTVGIRNAQVNASETGTRPDDGPEEDEDPEEDEVLP